MKKQNEQEFVKTIQVKGWSLREVLESYKSISLNALVKASLVDEELNYFLFSLAYYRRADISKRVHFEQIDQEFINETILESYSDIIKKLESEINSDKKEMTIWVMEDSSLIQQGGIFDMEQSIYLLRDQILCDTIYKIYNYLLFDPEDLYNSISHLIKYDSKVHRGNKFNCYKNHLVVDHQGLKIIGTSMLFQRLITLDQLKSFDSFFDVFDDYFNNILKETEINGNSVPNEKDFASDIKKILWTISENNAKFIVREYEQSINLAKIIKG
jgi:hypothetical protein